MSDRSERNEAGTQLLTVVADFMRQVLNRTWIATLLFTVAIAVGSMVLGYTPRSAATVTWPTLIVTPLIWWWLVRRKPMMGPGWGATAGALIVLNVLILAMVNSHFAAAAKRPPGWHESQGAAGLGLFFDLWLVVVVGMPGALAGAVYGAAIAWVGRALERESQSTRA